MSSRSDWMKCAVGSCLLLCITLSSSGADPAATTVLEPNRLHLGKSGRWEWDYFKDRPVDADRFERKFQAARNTIEHTLRIWQRDVKLSWPVKLNGTKLGMLVSSEPAMELVLRIPPGTLREGENVLAIDPPANLDDIEIGPVLITSSPVNDVLSGATLEVTVTDDTDHSMPCRLTITRPDGTLQPLRAEPAPDVTVRVGVVYTRNGKATLSLPPGDYMVYASRGFEWSVASATVSLAAGETKPASLKLRREVPTQSWIAADSHIHTLTHSKHGDATIEERMLTIAGEGIELAIATDHNHHTDYAPIAESTGLSNRFTTAIGNEVTTKHGHFNAFPIAPGSSVVNYEQDDWSKLIPDIRATPGVKVITLNHPRDLHSGFVPLGGMQFNPATGRHRQSHALQDVDALEVVTSAAMQSDIHLLYRDWFALLNHGHRISSIGSSDSHDVSRFILGQGRTYVAAKDADPASLDLDEVWRSYQEGRLLVSLGLLAQLKVNDRFGVGDLATGLGDTIKVEAAVLGPSWVQADHIELFANGKMIREQVIQDDHRSGEKARIIWQIPKPVHDVHLVVIATGPGVTAPYWEIPRPYQPSNKSFVPRVVGSTNPIWLDADGNGSFEPAIAIARKLIQMHGTDRTRISEALKNFDEPITIQVEALLAP